MDNEWKSWADEPPDKGIVEVVFMNSRVFPKGAVLTADAQEITAGVVGDRNPTWWRHMPDGDGE